MHPLVERGMGELSECVGVSRCEFVAGRQGGGEGHGRSGRDPYSAVLQCLGGFTAVSTVNGSTTVGNLAVTTCKKCYSKYQHLH